MVKESGLGICKKIMEIFVFDGPFQLVLQSMMDFFICLFCNGIKKFTKGGVDGAESYLLKLNLTDGNTV